MISAFFIDRPVFATVTSLIMVLAGAVALPLLPVEQYPDIAPPNVQITASYPGADAATIVDAVTAPIEQEVNGVEGMIYMKSATDQTGRVTIDVTFELGRDADQAVIDTQNRVAIAEPRLPPEVRARGVTVKKRSPSILMVAMLYSPDQSFDFLTLSNYTTLYIKDELARIEGVSEVFVFGGQDYAMRIWLDPDKLAARDMTTVDVLNALRAQNVQVAAGRVGAPPTQTQSAFEYVVNTEGRLQTVEQFESIILKTAEAQVDDQTVTRTLRLKDVAHIQLGAETYDWSARRNGEPSIAIGIFQTPGSNAVQVADAVRAKLDELAQDYPTGVAHDVTYDFTKYVRSSIREVVVTLFIAALLVVIITYLFLQDWRATLVPTITIPVSLIATFAIMLAFGFSINLFTLFGLILAIGIVVDDAIVVVEDTSRRITDGMKPREAAKQTMKEVSGALVATTLVVLAVFIPAAMIGGLTGVLYKQFALTIAFATCFSTINALTLSPMLCAIFLKPVKPVRFVGFKLFNSTLDRTRGGYLWFVNKGIRLAVLTVLIFGGLTAASVFGFKLVPTGFLPKEDQGYFLVNIQLPDGASSERTDQVLRRVEQIAGQRKGVSDVVAVSGFSLLSNTLASNNAMAIVVLEDWEDRDLNADGIDPIVADLGRQFAGIQEAIVFPFEPPAIIGIGQAGGVEYELQDRGANGYTALQQAADAMVFGAYQHPDLERPFTPYRATTPQLFVDIDHTKAQRLGVPPQVYNDTLQSNLGSAYVNDFNYYNRVYRVYLQADGPFRDSVDDIYNLKVRNVQGQTLPLGTFVEVRDTVGPQAINRYNQYPSASITAQPTRGKSTGEAIQAMRDLSAQNLPPGFKYEWTGSTFQELKTGSAAIIAFALGFAVVFMVLAAQYESWTTPIAILLTIPLGVLGAILGIYFRDFDINIYTQVGFILLIALVAKNAILIVEFAKQRYEEGQSPKDAAVEAASLRFRPILMTAFSFVGGTAPLVIATGAGAMSRQSLGTAVFFGMLLSTVIGIVFVPVFYYVIQTVVGKLKGSESVTS